MTGALDPKTQALLRETPTGVINDALLLAGIKGAMVGIHPARGFEDVRIAGPALTMAYGPAMGTGAYPKSPYEVFYEAEPGQVAVVAGNGTTFAFTGDNQAHTAKVHGVEAIVIDGGARDIAGIRAVGMPLFISTPSPRTSGGYLDMVNVNGPVQVGGVTVNAGDVVVGDEDGLVVIPRDKLDVVLDNINYVIDVEDQMEKAIAAKKPVAEVKALLAKKKARPAK